MNKGRIAPIRPSIAKILKRQIAGFVRELEREVNATSEPSPKPQPVKSETPPTEPPTPERPE